MAKEEKKEELKKEVQEIKKEEPTEEKEEGAEFVAVNLQEVYKDFKLVAARELISKGFKKEEVISNLKIVEAFIYYLQDHNLILGVVQQKTGLIENIDNILKEIMDS